jgi:5-methylcytosine-specific restriction endonuclease McrA
MKPINIDQIRSTALLKGDVSVEDVSSLLEMSEVFDRKLVAFTWSVVAHRLLMSLLPSFDGLVSYNDRKNALLHVIQQKGLIGRISDETVEHLLEIGDRLRNARAGIRRKSIGDLHYKTKNEMLLRQNHRCMVCGASLKIGTSGEESSPELDHIVPFSLRGNQESNTRIICKRCNNAKLDDLTYITTGRLALNDTLREGEPNMNRLYYWALEISGSVCESVGCGCSSLDGRLFIVKIGSLRPWILDNVNVFCYKCSSGMDRFPSE